MAMALGLVLGNKPDLTGHCGAGRLRPHRSRSKLARLSGPLLLVIAALGIVAALFRTQLGPADRAVLPRRLGVVIGLSEEAIPLLKRLAVDLPRGSTLGGADRELRQTRSSSRAALWAPAWWSATWIRPARSGSLVLRQNRFKVEALFFKVKALYVVSTDVPANLALAERFREIAPTRPAPTATIRRRG